jgi:hypothetical protein
LLTETAGKQLHPLTKAEFQSLQTKSQDSTWK